VLAANDHAAALPTKLMITSSARSRIDVVHDRAVVDPAH
jgi:hypothetical protein